MENEKLKMENENQISEKIVVIIALLMVYLAFNLAENENKRITKRDKKKVSEG